MSRRRHDIDCEDEVDRWRALANLRGRKLDEVRDLIEATDLTQPEAVELVLQEVARLVR